MAKFESCMLRLVGWFDRLVDKYSAKNGTEENTWVRGQTLKRERSSFFQSIIPSVVLAASLGPSRQSAAVACGYSS